MAEETKQENSNEEEKEANSEQSMREELYAKAHEIKTPEELVEFIKEAMDRPHGYGSVCVGIAACAVAAAWVADRQPQGGITGFQAGAVMWEFMRAWNNVVPPAKLIKYEDMLFPQYESKFAQNIHPKTWEWLREEATKRLSDKDSHMSDGVRAHMQSIKDGMVPFGFTVTEDN